MKVYFNASLAGKEKYREEFRTILKIIKDLGHQVYSDHVMKRDYRKVNKQTKKKHQRDFQEALKKIKHSQVMVIEATYPSIGLGRMLTLALEMKKSVLVLYQTTPHGLLLGDPNRFLSVRRYSLNSPRKLEHIIEVFLKKVEKRFRKKRFNFMLDERQEDYLEWLSLKEGVSKAHIIRQLIEKGIQKDKEYPK